MFKNITSEDKLNFLVGFINGAVESGAPLRMSDPDMARDTANFLRELKERRAKADDFAKAT